MNPRRVDPAKRSLRRSARDRLASWPLHARAAAEEQIRAEIERVLREQPVRSLAVFAALPGEPNLDAIIESQCAAGVEVCVPALAALPESSAREPSGGPEAREPEATRPRLVRIRSLSELREGPGGLRAPRCDEPGVDPGRLDLLLVPGLLFDRRGGRLGRGGGFYDRLLAGVGERRRILGVCFSIQLVAELPRAAHDVPVGGCVSEEGVLYFPGT